MKKIVINKCYGGFGLSHDGTMRYAEIKGITLYPWLDDITKEVYGARAYIGNEELCHHYSTKPVPESGEYEEGSYFSDRDIQRDDPALVQLVEEMGEAANGRCANLGVVKIPSGIEFTIEEYDGLEWVAEKHRTWG